MTVLPSGPVDTLVEMQLTTGEWVDITTYTRGADAHISGETGRPNQSTSSNPGHYSLILKNTDGRFTPRNARGAYYGLFGRGTPIRISVRPRLTASTMADLSDTFTRTVALGTSWGVSDTGQTWDDSSSSGSNLSVSSGTGRMAVGSVGQIVGARVRLTEASWHDVDFYQTFTIPAATGTGGITLSMVSRRDLDSTGLIVNNGPFVQATLAVGGVVTLKAFSADQNQIGSTVTVSGLTHTGQALRMRFRTAGLTVMAKVWAASGSEPASWQLIGTDTDNTTFPFGQGVRGPGSASMNVTALTGNTNTPFTAQFDNVAITAIEPRFCGEVNDWPVSWTPGARTTRGDVIVSVDAYDMTQRLARPSRQPPRSAMQRFLTINHAESDGDLSAYWPLTDGNLATRGTLVLSYLDHPKDATLNPATGVSQQEYWGQGDLNAPWLDKVVAMQGGDSIVMPVKAQTTGVNNSGQSAYAVDYIRAGNESATGTLLQVTNRFGSMWQLKYVAGASTGTLIGPDGSSVATPSTSNSLTGVSLFDGAPHHIRLYLYDNGGSIKGTVYMDGTDMNPGGFTFVTAETFIGIDTIRYVDSAAHTTSHAVGHFVAWSGEGTTVADCAKAALGYGVELPSLSFSGETAGARIVRLCQEEGIPLRVISSEGTDIPPVTTNTETVGPQPTAAAWDLITAAAEADQGWLYGARDFPGLEYRTRESAERQVAQVALTYTTDGHLQPGMAPTADTLQVTNDVTATRLYGSDSRYELTSGALSTNAPPAGVGRLDRAVTVSVLDDLRALHHAEWLVNSTTVDEERWPVIPLSLAHMYSHSLQTLIASVLRANQGVRITVGGMSNPDFLAPADIDQIILGQAESLTNFDWQIALNASPFTPYRTGTWDGTNGDEFCGRWDAAYSTLAASATSSATSLSVATSQGSLWTTSAGDLPFYVNISGVRIQVTAISGASSPQTFTVVRSVDGFDIALAAGATVSLWAPTRWGR